MELRIYSVYVLTEMFLVSPVKKSVCLVHIRFNKIASDPSDKLLEYATSTQMKFHSYVILIP